MSESIPVLVQRAESAAVVASLARADLHRGLRWQESALRIGVAPQFLPSLQPRLDASIAADLYSRVCERAFVQALMAGVARRA